MSAPRPSRISSAPPPATFDTVRNPLPAAGGVEPEDIEAARRDAPQAFRTQERAVTPADYAAAAERRPDVQRAAATFRWTGSWYTVFVTPDRFGGGEVDAALCGAAAPSPRALPHGRLRPRGQRAALSCRSTSRCTSACSPTISAPTCCRRCGRVLSSDVLPDGRLGLFHPDNFTFGQPVYLSRIVAAAQAVEGVEAVRPERFQRLVDPIPTSLDDGRDPDRRPGDRAARQQSQFPRARPARRCAQEAANERADARPQAARAAAAAGQRGVRLLRRHRRGDAAGHRQPRRAVGDRLPHRRLCAVPRQPARRAVVVEVRAAGASCARATTTISRIGLIDAFACAADVLTFYQERIANESYLRTAVERVSLQEMGKLIGYRLRPGVAAETWLAFALETPPTPPANLAPEPGNFVTGVPLSLTLDDGPARCRACRARARSRRPSRPSKRWPTRAPPGTRCGPGCSDPRAPGAATRVTWLAGLRNNLKPGDALLFVGDEFLANTNNNNWDFRMLDTVSSWSRDNDRTLVSWARGLGSIDPFSGPPQNPQVYALRKRAAVFGHNAPMWRSMPSELPHELPAAVWSAAIRPQTGRTFRLAAGRHVRRRVSSTSIRSIPKSDTGGYVVLAKGGLQSTRASLAPPDTYVELYRVTSVAEVSRGEFALSGKVTRLQLHGANYADVQRRSARDERLRANPSSWPWPNIRSTARSAATGCRSRSRADGLLPGRRLIVRGTRAATGRPSCVQATLVAAQPIGDRRAASSRSHRRWPTPLSAQQRRGARQCGARLARRDGVADPRRRRRRRRASSASS